MTSRPAFTGNSRQVMADKIKASTGSGGRYEGAIFCAIIGHDIKVCRCQDSCRIWACEAKGGKAKYKVRR